ncbi:MAG: hypothetical protein JSR19_08510 [Proteobacteria bacterium]|nr:hypothetical protein [Pseudomonadota bacterium]HQR04198.1 hypothetical protein [Rhodocyclaceae bacterium]
MKTEPVSRVLFAGLLGMSCIALAQGNDPTRPPNMDSAQISAASSNGAAASGLQTIIRRHGAKPAAVINGEYVVLGGRIGESRLVRVDEGSVTLLGPAGKETLMLTPGVEKTGVPVARATRNTRPRKAKPVDEARP